MASSMAPLHAIGQDYQNEVSAHVTHLTLASASCNANGIVKVQLHSLHKDNLNEVQHAFLVIDASVSFFDINSIVKAPFHS